MRPDLLTPLFASVTSLKGVGDKVEAVFARLFGRSPRCRIVDLLLHLPSGLVDRRYRCQDQSVTGTRYCDG